MKKNKPEDIGISTEWTKLKGGGYNVDINCSMCGQPITHSNEYGMFCDNECELKEAKQGLKFLNKMFKQFVKD